MYIPVDSIIENSAHKHNYSTLPYSWKQLYVSNSVVRHLWPTMLSSTLRSFTQPRGRRKPQFLQLQLCPNTRVYKIDEETLSDYVASQYHPTRIGEVIKERYQVVNKLGFGSTSTAWLARDMDSWSELLKTTAQINC